MRDALGIELGRDRLLEVRAPPTRMQIKHRTKRKSSRGHLAPEGIDMLRRMPSITGAVLYQIDSHLLYRESVEKTELHMRVYNVVEDALRLPRQERIPQVVTIADRHASSALQRQPPRARAKLFLHWLSRRQ